MERNAKHQRLPLAPVPRATTNTTDRKGAAQAAPFLFGLSALASDCGGITGNAVVASSPVGLVLTNALLLTGLAKFRVGRLGFRIGSFESQIDGSAAQRASAMPETMRNCCHLARGEMDFTVLEFDCQPAFDNKKCLV